jgi:hypothetical protein
MKTDNGELLMAQARTALLLDTEPAAALSRDMGDALEDRRECPVRDDADGRDSSATVE